MKTKGPKIRVVVARENQKVAVVEQKMLKALTKMTIIKMVTVLKKRTVLKKVILVMSHPESARKKNHRVVLTRKLHAVWMINPVPRINLQHQGRSTFHLMISTRVRVKESILFFRQGCGPTLGVQPRAIARKL